MISFQIQEVFEENEELVIINEPAVEGLEDDEYVNAHEIQENPEELYNWALVVEQVQNNFNSSSSWFCFEAWSSNR